MDRDDLPHIYGRLGLLHIHRVGISVRVDKMIGVAGFIIMHRLVFDLVEHLVG